MCDAIGVLASTSEQFWGRRAKALVVAPAVGQPHNSRSNLNLVSEGTSLCSFPFLLTYLFQNTAHLFSSSSSSSRLPIETPANTSSTSLRQWLRDNCNSPLPPSPPRDPWHPSWELPHLHNIQGPLVVALNQLSIGIVRWPSSLRSSVAITPDYVTTSLFRASSSASTIAAAMAQTSHPTLINLPPPGSNPETPSEVPYVRRSIPFAQC